MAAARDGSTLLGGALRMLAANIALLLAFVLWQGYALQQLEGLHAAQQTLQQLRAGLDDPSSVDAASTASIAHLAPEAMIARLRAARDRAAPIQAEEQRALRAQSAATLRGLDAHVARLRATMGFALGLLLIAGVLIQALALWSYRRRILQPLRSLAGRAERLATGRHEAPSPPSAHREFGVIADVLDDVGAGEAHLARLQQLDETTELPNRRAAREALARWVTEDATGAIIMLRVVNLGGVRAVYGEAEANAMLHRHARAVESAVGRWSELLAAYAEDVLILLVRSGAEAALADIVKAVLESGDDSAANSAVRAKQVAAIALFPVHGDSVDAVIGQASTALDHATARGAGAVERARDAAAGTLREHLAHNEAIRRAVEDDRLELWYMPIVDVRELPGRVCHVEALMRMRDADGAVHPVPVEMMERLLVTPELILPASERCFRQACDTLVSLRADGHDIALAFNLAAPELRDEHLARLNEIFTESGLPPSALMLEITERVALRGMDKVVPRLQSAREQGVRVVLDDFGTGYSSLSHLVELPIDGIKIDRAFIKGLESDTRSREVVSATNALAKVLRLEVVGEGVETEAQRDLLRELGCSLHQGYLYAKAMPADQLRLRLTAGV